MHRLSEQQQPAPRSARRARGPPTRPEPTLRRVRAPRPRGRRGGGGRAALGCRRPVTGPLYVKYIVFPSPLGVVVADGTRYRPGMGLSEPALSLTDLALGLVVIALAVRLQGTPGVHRYWRLTFWWAWRGGAGGRGPPRRRDLLRHVVGTELGGDQHDGRRRGLLPARRVGGRGARLRARPRLLVLRSAGLVAYAGLAIAGYAGVNSILACEGVTMLAILWLWGRACARAMLALPVIVAILAKGAAAGGGRSRTTSRASVGLDPTSLYHLAQIPGMVLFFLALAAAPQWLRRPARAGPVAAAR